MDRKKFDILLKQVQTPDGKNVRGRNNAFKRLLKELADGVGEGGENTLKIYDSVESLQDIINPKEGDIAVINNVSYEYFDGSWEIREYDDTPVPHVYNGVWKISPGEDPLFKFEGVPNEPIQEGDIAHIMPAEGTGIPTSIVYGMTWVWERQGAIPALEEGQTGYGKVAIKVNTGAQTIVLYTIFVDADIRSLMYVRGDDTTINAEYLPITTDPIYTVAATVPVAYDLAEEGEMSIIDYIKFKWTLPELNLISVGKTNPVTGIVTYDWMPLDGKTAFIMEENNYWRTEFNVPYSEYSEYNNIARTYIKSVGIYDTNNAAIISKDKHLAIVKNDGIYFEGQKIL